MTKEIEHPMVKLLMESKEKFLALVIWKYAKGHAMITEEDMLSFPPEMTLICRGHPNAVQLYAVLPKDAAKIVEEVNKKGGMTFHE